MSKILRSWLCDMLCDLFLEECALTYKRQEKDHWTYKTERTIWPVQDSLTPDSGVTKRRKMGHGRILVLVLRREVSSFSPRESPRFEGPWRSETGEGSSLLGFSSNVQFLSCPLSPTVGSTGRHYLNKPVAVKAGKYQLSGRYYPFANIHVEGRVMAMPRWKLNRKMLITQYN